jgi:pilus assembly protein CpaC
MRRRKSAGNKIKARLPGRFRLCNNVGGQAALVLTVLLLTASGASAGGSSGVPMIQIAVEIAEVNNNMAKELGVTWIDEIKTAEGEVPSVFTSGDWKRLSAITADLKMLADRGAAKIMSKPKIATKSGTTAKFLAGGALPVIASGIGGGKIEWKEYGIRVEVKPEVTQDGGIDAFVSCEVSRPDWTNKVMEFPAISARQAEASVRMRNGETLAIAGLGETKKETKTKGVPFLMDVPLIGLLFSRKTWMETENTIMIFVTAKILP